MIETETDPRATMKGMAQSLDNMAEALTMIAAHKGIYAVVVNFRPFESGFDLHVTATNTIDEKAIVRHMLDGLEAEAEFNTILRERNAKLEAVADAARNSACGSSDGPLFRALVALDEAKS